MILWGHPSKKRMLAWSFPPQFSDSNLLLFWNSTQDEVLPPPPTAATVQEPDKVRRKSHNTSHLTRCWLFFFRFSHAFESSCTCLDLNAASKRRVWQLCVTQPPLKSSSVQKTMKKKNLRKRCMPCDAVAMEGWKETDECTISSMPSAWCLQSLFECDWAHWHPAAAGRETIPQSYSLNIFLCLIFFLDRTPLKCQQTVTVAC